MSANVWLGLLAMLGGSVVGPGALALIRRLLPSRGETAEAKVAEVTADTTAAGAWQGLYIELKHEIDGLKIEVAQLREALAERDMRVQVQSTLLRSVGRWALLLKDALLRAGIEPPPTPVDVEAALTSLDS